MIKWTKRHFIPTSENQFQPHFLRLKVALSIFLLVVTIEATYLLATIALLPRSEQFAAIFAAVLIDQTNQVRQTDSLSTLRTNPLLENAARMKAEDMAAKGYFAHNAPDGKTPWYWFDIAGYDYAAAGENLAVNFTDSKDVTEAWMRSPGHRANIMSGNYTEIGVATAAGTYKGKPAIFVVQAFGRPSIIARQIEQTSSTVASLTALITGSNAPTVKAVPSALVIKTVPPPLAVPVMRIPQVTPVSREANIPTTTTVAGAETAKLDAGNIVVASAAPVVAAQPSQVARIIASPRSMTTTIFLIFGALLSLALGLAIFIKIRIQHPHIIANGVLLIAIMISLTMINAILMASRGAI